jgi:hypothetical protein
VVVAVVVVGCCLGCCLSSTYPLCIHWLVVASHLSCRLPLPSLQPLEALPPLDKLLPPPLIHHSLVCAVPPLVMPLPLDTPSPLVLPGWLLHPLFLRRLSPSQCVTTSHCATTSHLPGLFSRGFSSHRNLLTCRLVVVSHLVAPPSRFPRLVVASPPVAPDTPLNATAPAS